MSVVPPSPISTASASHICLPAELTGLREQICEAIARRMRLRIQGGDTKRHLRHLQADPGASSGEGVPSGGDTTDMPAPARCLSAPSGILDYDPAELVLTARAGTPLLEIETRLAARGQYLPFDPPRLGGASALESPSTLGGAIASGLSGPARPYRGAAKDFVLGAHLLDGRGNWLRFGGKVMKNVAGFDLPRLLTGSWGRLGLITQISLKVLPCPAASQTRRYAMTEREALHHMQLWASQPWAISASCWHPLLQETKPESAQQAGSVIGQTECRCSAGNTPGILSVRYAGAVAAVEAACRTLGGESLATAEAEAFWSALRDQRAACFMPEAPSRPGKTLWRFSLPADAPALDPVQLGYAAEDYWIHWGGAERWLWSKRPAAALHAAAATLGGYATPWRFPAGQRFTAADMPPAQQGVATIQKRLYATFDPQGIFM